MRRGIACASVGSLLIASAVLILAAPGVARAQDSKPETRSCPRGEITMTVDVGGASAEILSIVGRDGRPCSKRWLSAPGDRVTVIAVAERVGDQDKCPPGAVLTWDEPSRIPQIEQDFQTLLKILSQTGALRAAEGGAECKRETYSLTHRYGTLAVKISVPGSGAAGKPPAKELKTEPILTGPAEHFSLSVNVPITRAKQLKYSSDSKSLTTTETPQKFMLGIDYWLSDLAAQKDHRVGLRALFELSSRPTTSYGLAVAYRGRFLGMEAFSPFAGALLTRSDELKNGQASFDTGQKLHFVAGLSFNLDAALAWTKSSKKN